MVSVKNTGTIESIRTKLNTHEVSAVEVAKQYLSTIDKRDKDIGAYLEVYEDVLGQAKEADKRIAEGNGGLLNGVPIALKDNILVKGKKK